MRPKGQIFDLRAFRRDHNLTQKEIAEAVNRPQSFLSAIEHGKRSAPPGFLDDLTRLYDVNNISDYIRERDEPTFGEVKNVKDAIVNSPGGLILLNEFGDRLSTKEILRILSIESEAREQEEKELTPAPQLPAESSTVSDLVKLLADAQNRCNIAEARCRELEKMVSELQAQLPKKRKK